MTGVAQNVPGNNRKSRGGRRNFHKVTARDFKPSLSRIFPVSHNNVPHSNSKLKE
jgi:hypothetical protein